MKESDLKLWKMALQEAMEEKQNEEMEVVTEEILPSAQHSRKVKRMLGVDDERRKRYPAKRLLAWGLAAVLLMASALTAYAYNGTSYGFSLESHGPYTVVGFAYSFDIQYTSEIEEAYELGYLPSDYHRTRLYEHQQRIECTYRNGEGGAIEFQQYPLGKKETWGFRNELGERVIKQYGETYVYCFNADDDRTFLWRDQKYAMVLFVGADMSDSEIEKIINGVQLQVKGDGR